MHQPDPQADLRANLYDLDLLHVEQSGPEQGPPLLILHGWGSSAALMQPVAMMFADRRRVYNVDLPGHGRSPIPPEAWGVPEYARLVGRVIDRFGLDAVPVIGHSNGGRIALFMASDPALSAHLSRLVLISPSGIRRRRTWKVHLRRTVATLLKAPFLWLPEPFKGRTLAWLRRTLLWKALGSSDYRTLHGVMRETFVKTVNCYLEDRIGRIRIPTLIFRGDRDDAISLEQVRTLERKIPDAALVALNNAGHYGYLDDPSTFSNATRHFLDAADARASDATRPSRSTA